jgi:hypothetical protein
MSNNPLLNNIYQQNTKNPALNDIFNSLKNGANPKELLKNFAGNNPLLNSMLNGNMSMQQMAEQLCQQKGIDPNQALSQIKNQYGIK